MPAPEPDVLEAAIERALAPYARLLPRAALDKMREQMREYASTHPYPVALLRQLSPATVQASHVTASEATAIDDRATTAAAPLRRIPGGRGGAR